MCVSVSVCVCVFVRKMFVCSCVCLCMYVCGCVVVNMSDNNNFVDIWEEIFYSSSRFAHSHPPRDFMWLGLHRIQDFNNQTFST